MIDLLPLNHVLGLPGDELSFSLQNKDLIELVKKNQEDKKLLVTTIQQSFTINKPISIFGVKAEVIEIDHTEKSRFMFFSIC